MIRRIPDRIHPLRTSRRRLLVSVLAVLVAVIAYMPRYQQAHAATPTICTLIGSQLICPNYAPPDLLTPGAFIYATPAQVASVQTIETQAISNTITDHGLADSDADAVKSWGRYDAEAELFALFVKAIKTPTASRSMDQQNAVDWLAEFLRLQAVSAADNVASEYVDWAGLDKLDFQSLLLSNPSEDALRSFLSGPVVNYNNTNTSKATGGYCVYHSPAPYQDEYAGRTDQTCFTACSSVLGCNPPTPSYDQFVKWGEADSTYGMLGSSLDTEVAANLALSAAYGGAVVGAGVTGVALSSALAGVLTGSALQLAIFPFLGTAGYGAAAVGGLGAEAALELAGAVTASSVGFIVGVAIAAIAAAVLQGLTIANADALPGKLASLVAGAETTTPDLGALINDTNGATSIFTLFTSLMFPLPTTSRKCDNSVLSTKTWFTFKGKITDLFPDGVIPPSYYGVACLNPTTVPPAAGTDAHFDVTAMDTGTRTTSPTITTVDQTLGITTTARLSGHWFIARVNGSDEIQMLRIPYTDWLGKEETAWLTGNPHDGYRFVGVTISSGTSTPVDPATCAANGTCWSRPTLRYVGGNGKNYSATVEPYTPPTGAPFYTSAAETHPFTFMANHYAPGAATGIVTYQWRFQKAGCGIPCQSFSAGSFQAGPAYTDPIFGPTAAYTWQTTGSYLVQLTATDMIGKQAVDTFSVQVGDVPPSLTIAPDCTTRAIPVSCNVQTGQAGTPITIAGSVGHAGSLDNETVTINWGDGSDQGSAGGGPNILNVFGNPVTLTPSGSSFSLSATHNYTTPGIYFATVTAAD